MVASAPKPLSLEFMLDNWLKLRDLDQYHVDRGFLESWDRRQYELELRDKWQLSFCILQADTVLAYRIASGEGKRHNFAHTHRTSVHPAALRAGLGSKLLHATSWTARELGYVGLTGLVEPWNHRSRSFLEARGWRFAGEYIRGKELWLVHFDD